MEDRVIAALEIAVKYGSVDGAHHKTWVIDQMVRALTGCPLIERQALDVNGTPYTYMSYGESEHYRDVLAVAGAWDEGIAP